MVVSFTIAVKTSQTLDAQLIARTIGDPQAIRLMNSKLKMDDDVPSVVIQPKSFEISEFNFERVNQSKKRSFNAILTSGKHKNCFKKITVHKLEVCATKYSRK